MRCGTKCFQVEFELKDKNIEKFVVARTPQEARKFIRKEYGSDINIISVRSKTK